MTKATLLIVLSALLPIPAQAGWECTMPNGVTIQRQFGQCPSDAIQKRQTSPDPDPPPVVAVTPSMICKAAIATVMAKDPAIIQTRPAVDGTITLSYIRSSDRSTWSYKCKTNGNQIMWGSLSGRWRNDPMDGKVLFQKKDGKLSVQEKYSDGSANERIFEANSLK